MPPIEGGSSAGGVRRPSWLRKGKPIVKEVIERKAGIARLGLHTVCESARCPNLSECFNSGNATFLILGELCTRGCGFCSVEKGIPVPPDPHEGARIAEYMAGARIRYAVITSVTRDDLPDGGAAHFARVVSAVNERLPSVGLELLVPDFKGDPAAVDLVASLPIEVFGHNVETVASLYPRVRRGAEYARSLAVLSRAAARKARVKSGVMVGLGETRGELVRLFADLSEAGVSMLTIGQYLMPRRGSVRLERFVSPEEFEELGEEARRAGIANVFSGPYVRSSYLAEDLARGGSGVGRPAAGKKV